MSTKDATNTLIFADCFMITPAISLIWFTRFRKESYAWEISSLITAFLCIDVYDLCDVNSSNHCVQAHDAIKSFYDQSCLFLMPISFSPFFSDEWRFFYLGLQAFFCTLLALLLGQHPASITIIFFSSLIPYLIGYFRFIWKDIFKSHKCLFLSFISGLISVSFRITSDIYQQNQTSDFNFELYRAMWRIFACCAMNLLYYDINIESYNNYTKLTNNMDDNNNNNNKITSPTSTTKNLLGFSTPNRRNKYQEAVFTAAKIAKERSSRKSSLSPSEITKIPISPSSPISNPFSFSGTTQQRMNTNRI